MERSRAGAGIEVTYDWIGFDIAGVDTEVV